MNEPEEIAAVVAWPRLQAQLEWLRRGKRLLIASIVPQQAIGTVWFWAANIEDQLHATGAGENTATWLGGGLGFMLLVAYMQWHITRLQPTRQNRLLLFVQLLSALGNAAALSIFTYRRFSWTTADTACAGVIVFSLTAVFLWYWRRRTDVEQPSSLRYFLMAGWLTALLAIELRGIPRVFQGASLLIHNPMSIFTVLSGCYIAAVRLAGVYLTTRRTPSPMARRIYRTELFGNMGSQLLLCLGWLIAVTFH